MWALKDMIEKFSCCSTEVALGRLGITSFRHSFVGRGVVGVEFGGCGHEVAGSLVRGSFLCRPIHEVMSCSVEFHLVVPFVEDLWSVDMFPGRFFELVNLAVSVEV